MFINKIGYSHLVEMKNCQDFGFEKENIKCVVDGCSEGLHSEVGVKLFCYLHKDNLLIESTFNKIFNIININSIDDIKNYLLFTILLLKEDEKRFLIYGCGDGVIIKQKYDDTFEYENIEQNNIPKYYAYNYVPIEFLNHYKNGVNIDVYKYNKDEYKSIGIATDGLNYILNSEFKEEFEKYLLNRKDFAIKRLINREHKYFKDDITIVI